VSKRVICSVCIFSLFTIHMHTHPEEGVERIYLALATQPTCGWQQEYSTCPCDNSFVTIIFIESSCHSLGTQLWNIYQMSSAMIGSHFPFSPFVSPILSLSIFNYSIYIIAFGFLWLKLWILFLMIQNDKCIISTNFIPNITHLEVAL